LLMGPSRPKFPEVPEGYGELRRLKTRE